MLLIFVDMGSLLDVIRLALQMQHFFTSLSFDANLNKKGHCYFFSFGKFVLYSFFSFSGLFNGYLDPLG